MNRKGTGLVHIYFGDGKGKTTTGMGLCVRAAGYGYRVLIYQFMKNNKTSERNILEKIENITIVNGLEQEKFSRRIAANIVKARQEKPIETTFQLVDIIKASMPQRAMRDGHPARRSFQAIRIEVNGELDVLQQALHDAFDCLNPGGRLVIITFHSLEDRMVKNAFAQWSKGCTCPKEFPVCVCGNKPKGKALKSVAPSAAELEENPRARSARLRVFEKY